MDILAQLIWGKKKRIIKGEGRGDVDSDNSGPLVMGTIEALAAIDTEVIARRVFLIHGLGEFTPELL